MKKRIKLIWIIIYAKIINNLGKKEKKVSLLPESRIGIRFHEYFTNINRKT